MMRKLVAALLLVLAASPFTAPFATCDVATLFGHDDAALAGGWTSKPVIAVDRSGSTTICTAVQRSRAPFKLAAAARTTAARIDLFVLQVHSRQQDVVTVICPSVPLRI